MKIKSVRVTKFKRFHDLSIQDLPPARLIIMAGPNGSGKSSLFDAFSVWSQANHHGLHWDEKYYSRDSAARTWQNNIQMEFQPGAHPSKKSFYLRTAYRNDPDFEISNLQRQTDPSEQFRVRRMIETDGAVSQNYQRLASDAFEDVFDRVDGSTTIAKFRENTIGEIRDAVKRLFPELELNTLGNPLSEGTFRFSKGAMTAFSYKNLSGGEKSAFDLLLDMVVKRRTFNDTVYAIDEPEAHMSTRLQGALLQELYNLIPDGSQMWVATHSIGMMRKARELYEKHPGEVIFLDFENQDYDEPVVLKPVGPTRAFWERVLKVALDDLADLVAPKEIVICEGNPNGPVAGKNAEHDARCFEAIFADTHPDTQFISAGNSHDVAGDRLRFAAVFPNVIKGIAVRRVIDRDDHAPADVIQLKSDGVRTLRRRHLESYLYDEEVLSALYDQQGRTADFPALQAARAQALADSVAAPRNNAPDDIKSAAPAIYTFVKSHLGLTACGNNQMAFARTTLAPLIKPGMTVYQELEEDIFGA
jgi:predicted ATPase